MMCLAPASSVFVCTKPLALQELVGQHPKPFDRAAPAGRQHFSYTILLTSTKSLHDKALRPRQRVSEGFASF